MRSAYDDSLDAFGVHCVGGIVGALLTGVLANEAIGGVGGSVSQLIIQIEGVALTLVWSGVGSFIIFKVIDMVIGLRVSEDIERDGLDLGLHGETRAVRGATTGVADGSPRPPATPDQSRKPAAKAAGFSIADNRRWACRRRHGRCR